MKNKMKLCVIAVAGALLMGPVANAQSVTTQDISAQLQSSLEASVPTVVYFGFDKDEITEDSAAVLAQQASWLLSNPNANVNLAGHTDAVGSDEYNFDLAMRRAKAVENYLISQGVNPAQMQSVVSRGEVDLAVATEKRERLNRRVTTGVNGLVEIVARAPEPAPVLPPASRAYADNAGLICSTRRGASLTSVTDFGVLNSELTSRMDRAATIYASESAIDSTSNRFNLAHFTKTECGIAIGFAKSKIMDERSITHCACFSDALAELDG